MTAPDIEIQLKAPWPAGALSNLAANPFSFRGEPVASMEGLLQSLKTADLDAQRRIRALTGLTAKRAGAGLEWRETFTLHWRSEALGRDAPDYQRFLDEAFAALFAGNARSQRALLATGDARLTHAIGSDDETETVLTAAEFCDRLMRIRSLLASSPQEFTVAHRTSPGGGDCPT